MLKESRSWSAFRCTFACLLFAAQPLGGAHAAEADGTEMYAGDFVKGIAAEFPPVGNRWNLLRLRLANPHDRPVDLLVAVYFDVDSTLQFGRRIQIPPLTQVRTWLPIRLPDPEHIVDRAFSYRVLVRSMGDSSGLLPDESGALQLERTLQVESSKGAAGIIHTLSTPRFLDTEPVKDPTADAFTFMQTARYGVGLRRNWKALQPGFGAGGETGLEGLSEIVVANDALLEDPDGLNAVRRWLYGGGDLWVMLDRADSRNLEILLGNRYEGAEVERVQLTNVQLVDARGKSLPVQKHDVPVAMTRLLIDGADVLFTVDGWPAAFWIQCGRGRLLVTTLGANGWVRPRRESDPPTLAGKGWQTDYVPLNPFHEIASSFFIEDDSPASIRPVFASQVNDYVGYRIPDWNLIVGILAGYGIVTVALAACLWKAGRLPLFGALAPLLAVIAAGTLLAAGTAGRNMPSTAVELQLVTPIPGTGDVRVEGVAGLYAADSSSLVLSGRKGGSLTPDTDGFVGGIRTLTHRGLARWSWEHLRSTPGLRTADFWWSGRKTHIEARATFDERGLSGTLEVPGQLAPEDAVIATSLGRLGANLTDRARFAAGENDVLANDQFLGADLLGDERRRRATILESLWADSSKLWDPNQPRLLFWTQPWDLGFEYGDDVDRRGTALVSVPMRLERPPAGTRIAIPSPLLIFREVKGPDGRVPSGIYNRRTREWSKKDQSSASWFGFRVPPELLPVSPGGADVRIAVSGPIEKLELAGWNGQARVELRSWDNPVGTLSAGLQEDGLSLSAEGRLLLFVSVSAKERESPREQPSTPWRIESLQLSLQATIEAAENESRSE